MRRSFSLSLLAFLSLLPISQSHAQQRSLAADGGLNAAQFRKNVGRQLVYVCAPEFSLYAVWGTDAYTDDSAICSAAVHAGVITRARGGIVTIVMGKEGSRFAGSERNGIKSRDWEGWDGTYTFTRETSGQIDWTTTAYGLPKDFSQQLTLTCPAGNMDQVSRVYGSGVYTDDTPICAAALHAGLVTLANGGTIKFEARGPQVSFPASTRNGVSSYEYGSWAGSFSFAGFRADSLDIGRTGGTNTVPITVKPGGLSVDSLDNFRVAGELYTKIARSTITTGPTTTDGISRLSLNVLDGNGTPLPLTETVEKAIPILWGTSNSKCVAFVSGSGTSSDAKGSTVETKNFGCDATITSTVRKPAGLSTSAPTEFKTTYSVSGCCRRE